MTKQSTAKQYQNSHAALNDLLIPVIRRIASKNAGRCLDIEFSLKSIESIVRKMNEQDITDICDLSRFAIGFNTNEYFKNVLAYRKDLINAGFEEVKNSNYWNKAEVFGYMGYNSAWRTNDGRKFEVQFHTFDSFRVKLAVHPLYEQFRVIRGGDKNILNKMAVAWRTVVIPENSISL